MIRSISLVSIAWVLNAAAAVASVPEPRVLGVEVQGTPEIRAAAIGVGLQHALGEPISDAAVRRGVERLKKIGRAAAVKVDFRQADEGVWICYAVRENPVIESIDFEGNELMSAEELLADLAIAPGDILDYDVLYREVNRIPSVYLNRKGILYAGVLSPASVRVEGGHVTIEVKEFKLKDLIVRGVSGNLKSAVLKSLKLPRGAALRRTQLLGSLFDVYQLPRVKEIEYLPQFDRTRGELTLVLNLTEGEEKKSAASPARRTELN